MENKLFLFIFGEVPELYANAIAFVLTQYTFPLSAVKNYSALKTFSHYSDFLLVVTAVYLLSNVCGQ